MGRDYEAAVTSAAFIGFNIGSTATAIANMQAHHREVRPGAEVIHDRSAGRRVLHRPDERGDPHRLPLIEDDGRLG